jgi:predicted ArsR family transcriptional regulator
MDVPPLPDDDPLARDTRGQLFELLGQLGRTATTDELAATLELHPNGIRRHLEQLQLAGLIRRDSVRQPRGRPKDGWSIDPDARPGGEPPRGYEELGRWLARAIPARPDNLRDIEATGRMIGRELPEAGAAGDRSSSSSGLEDFEQAVTWLGFAPHAERSERSEHAEHADEITYRLTNCPYRQAVQENQPVICTLHKGILSGLLETLEPDAEISGFRARDPNTAGCTVTLALARRAAAARDRAH